MCDSTWVLNGVRADNIVVAAAVACFLYRLIASPGELQIERLLILMHEKLSIRRA